MDEEVTKHAPARDTRRLVRRLAPGGCECCAAGTMKNPTNPSTCDGCSHSFDEHCVPEVECPECGQDERVISRKIWEHYRRADTTTEICPGSGLELTVDAVGNVMRKQLQRERLTDGPVPGGFVPLTVMTWPDAEARELAGRIALDEAAEGDFATAAELKSFAAGGPVGMRGEAGPELLLPLKPGQLQVGVALEPIATGAEGIVMLGGVPTEQLLGTGAIAAMLEQDIEEIVELLVKPSPDLDVYPAAQRAIAEGLINRGWVPGARRRAVELPKATATLTDDERYEDQPIEDDDGTVIGHIWELERRFLLEHPREWVAAVDDNHENRPRFSSREGAEAWVRANAPRDGRPLTVPYDAEKVLGLKGAVVGWVWLDPEHAGDDGRWLAVHGAHPEHQHSHWGAPLGMDARNQAIGWVLEQDKKVRRGE